MDAISRTKSWPFVFAAIIMLTDAYSSYVGSTVSLFIVLSMHLLFNL